MHLHVYNMYVRSHLCQVLANVYYSAGFVIYFMYFQANLETVVLQSAYILKKTCGICYYTCRIKFFAAVGQSLAVRVCVGSVAVDPASNGSRLAVMLLSVGIACAVLCR